MADPEGLLDLNGEAGKQVAERVLQREAHHNRADGCVVSNRFQQQHRCRSRRREQ
jgi:hypothetical protein